MGEPWFALVESNTTGSGRQFCEAARRRGLRPVVLAERPDRYPFLATDGVDAVRCDTADAEPIFTACGRLARTGAGLAGVASSSEYFIAAAAATAARFGLPGADAEALRHCRHKDRQRAALARAGVPVPRNASATTPSAAGEAAGRIGWPVVVKPTTGSGSAGVRLCHDAGQVRRNAAALLATTVNERGLPVPRRILVEEYVEGPEFSVETFAGAAVAVVGKHLGPPPHFVETGHDVPAAVAEPVRAALRAVACRAVAALNVGWGAAHTELRLTPRGPVVIEVNPRLAGGMIPALVALSHGVDLVDAVVARSSGTAAADAADAVAVAGSAAAAHAAIRFLVAPGAGELVGVDGLAAARAGTGVHAVEVTAAPGARIEVTHSFRDRIGYAIAVGADAAEAGARADDALRALRLRLR